MSKQTLYSKRTNLVIGFHGCDHSVVEKVIKGENLTASMNDYDWLGNGVYFWENNAERALQWAKDLKKEKPAIIGAIIDLGYCMDLIDSEFLKELKEAYLTLERTIELTGNEMPKNEGSTPDKLLRKLDCAVIEMACKINADAGLTPYDSVRGVFLEGNELYPNAFFKEKNHIQICVRNPNCIKGYFLPREINDDYLIP
jgi:hypothetical protein